MISSDLFIIVAESIVILGPISQVGWANADCGLAASIRSRLQVRNGPPLAVRINFLGGEGEA